MLDYRTQDAIEPERPAKRLVWLLLCCSILAFAGALVMAAEAHRQYRMAMALPGERVTGAERIERAVVRVASGFDKTYASRPRYRAVMTATFTRAAMHAVVVWQLWRFARGAVAPSGRLLRA